MKSWCYKLEKILPYKYWVAIIYGCVIFLDRLDLTIVNIALPAIAQNFDVAVTDTQWISTAFLLALALAVPISGWAGDRFGVKRIFIIATTIYGLGSVACALSDSLWVMVACRFIQGIGGGMLIPVGATLVYRAFDPDEYASITSFIFIPTLLAPAIAPFIGGLILQVADWPWIFSFTFPICAVAVLLSFIILQEHEVNANLPLDWLGFIYASGFLMMMLYGLSRLAHQGSDAISLMDFIAALIMLAAFIRQERLCQHPLVPLRFFQNRLFLQANLTQISFQICHFGSIFLIGMYLQIGLGMAPLAAGLVMGMQALGAMCSSRFSVRLFNRYGPGVPISIGLAGLALFSYSVLYITSADQVAAAAIIVFMRGIFTGLCGTPVQTASVIEFNKTEIARANAIFNAGRQISISLGTALSSLLIAYGMSIYGLESSEPIYNSQVAYEVFSTAFTLIPVAAIFGLIVTMSIKNKQILAKLNAA